MKKISKKLVIVSLLLLGIFPQSVAASASSIDSTVGITFNSSPSILPDIGGKVPEGGKSPLPATGEIISSSLCVIGVLILLLVLYTWWKRRKEEA